MFGGSAKGDLFSLGPETGELTEVASAKRAVRATFCEEEVEELEPVLVDRVVIDGAFSSDKPLKSTDCGPLFAPTITEGSDIINRAGQVGWIRLAGDDIRAALKEEHREGLTKEAKGTLRVQLLS